MSNTPKIRFKGFTDDWEQRKCGEIASFSKGNGYSKSDLMESGTPIILYGRLYTKYEFSISEVDTFADEKSGSIFSEGNEVIVPASGETAEDIARAAAVVNTGIMLGGDLNIIKPKDMVIPEFLALNLSNGEPQRDLAKRAQGKSVVHVHNSDIQEVTICYPTVQEQNRIAEYFKGLDHLITRHQRKCDEMKMLKKSMLQKMFPQKGEKQPRIRFKGFTDDWEQRKLKDFGKATGGTSIESEFCEGGKYKVISIGSYSEQSVYTDQGLRANETEKTKVRILNKDDLTMILNDKTTSGNIIGRVLLIDADDSYVYNQRTERIEVKQDKYVPKFLYQLLNADCIRNKIIKASQGNTQIYVNWPVISEINYLVPKTKGEQEKIGSYFQKLDNLITLHQRKCDNLKELKKYMLQKMFPKKG